MLINLDSPLRRPPINLNPTQAQFLDGVRVAVEMIDVAYQQLVWQLQSICPKPPANFGQRGIFSAPAFLNAWSIVDNVHRLRGLIENFPRFAKKKQVVEVRLFLESAETVEKLRNAVQHMEAEIRGSAPQGHGVWGSLSWMFRADDENVLSCFLTLGALMPAADIGRTIPAMLKPGVDGVTLKVGETSVDLTRLMATIPRLVNLLDSLLEEQFSQAPAERAESDYFLAIAMKRGPNSSLIIPATEPEPQSSKTA